MNIQGKPRQGKEASSFFWLTHEVLDVHGREGGGGDKGQGRAKGNGGTRQGRKFTVIFVVSETTETGRFFC